MVISAIQHLTQIVGITFSLFGTIVVRYPDLEHPSISCLVRRLVPSVADAEGLETIRNGRTISEKGQLKIAERIFDERYSRDLPDSKPEKLSVTANSFYIEYENGNKIKNPHREREAGKIEKRLVVDWIVRRVAVSKGMIIVSVGFFLLLVSAILSLF